MTWKPPRRRAYRPKPLDAGQVLVWTHGDYPKTERIGTIWSAGPERGTYWAIPSDPLPDDGGPAVLVRVHTHGRRKGDAEQQGAYRLAA